MKRTQLYLDEDMARTLAAESRRRGTTVSELVREAIATVYGRGARRERRAIIHRLAGVWADRDDLGDTQEFVRTLRAERPLPAAKPTRATLPARHRRHH
jgi:hypothetical protein